MNKFVYAIVTWLGVVQSLDWLYTRFEWQNPPFVWAITTTTILCLLYLGFAVCTLRVMIYHDRIETCAQAKKALEEQLLKNRLSSKPQ